MSNGQWKTVPVGLLQSLIDVGSRKIGHAEAGLCPDRVEGCDARDDECPACQVLTEASRIAAAHDAPSSDPVAIDANWLSNVIRSTDGSHTIGAGELAEKIVAAIGAPPPAVPEGWALVPVEPTEEMLTASRKILQTGGWSTQKAYAAMLAAAKESRHD